MIVKQIGYFKESDVNELRQKGTEFSFYKTHKNTVIIVLGSSHRFGNVLYYPKYNRLPWKVTEGKKIVSIKEKLNSVDISEWNNKEQIMVYERI